MKLWFYLRPAVCWEGCEQQKDGNHACGPSKVTRQVSEAPGDELGKLMLPFLSVTPLATPSDTMTSPSYMDLCMCAEHLQ